MRKKVTLVLVLTLLCSILSSMFLLNVSQAGTKWILSTVDSRGDVGSFSTSIAVIPLNEMYPCISYYDLTNKDLKYIKGVSEDSVPQTVDSAGDVGMFSSIALDANQDPCISYYDNTNGDLKFARYANTGWTIFPTPDTAGNVGRFCSLALDTNGNPCISYYDADNGDLKYAWWSGSGWFVSAVDSVGIVGEYTSIATDSSGNPHISYYDVTNGNLRYAKWSSASGWFKEDVDSEGDVGMFSSIALDSSNNPHISYYDNTNKDLKYAWFDGSTWHRVTVDSAGDVGEYSSLGLDPSGYFLISYYDARNGDLKYARQTALLGGTIPLRFIETVDSAGDVGKYTSLDVKSNKYAFISYCDESNHALKLAREWPAHPWCEISINGGDAYTNSSSVTLSLNYTAYRATVKEAIYGNTYNFEGETWEAPATSKEWLLTSGDGWKTVWFDVKDSDGDTSHRETSDTIMLDTTPPTGSITINDGNASTPSTSVTLSLSSTDATSGVDKVRYSNDGVWDNETWEDPAASKAWNLTSGDGTKIVSFQVKDKAGLISSTYIDTINYVAVKVATPTFNPVAGTYTSSQSVTLSCDTEGATIRYTTDSSEPSASSTLYSSPISIGVSTTVNAKAFKAGMTDSDAVTATYTINGGGFPPETYYAIAGAAVGIAAIAGIVIVFLKKQKK